MDFIYQEKSYRKWKIHSRLSKEEELRLLLILMPLSSLLKFFEKAALKKTPPVLKAPSFDHELKDPVPDLIEIESDTNIIIIEGL